MTIAPFSEPKAGDYVTRRGRDTAEEREDARRVLRNQGCRGFRFELLPDGTMQAHGYLADIVVPE
jgi:hypothetical protein